MMIEVGLYLLDFRERFFGKSQGKIVPDYFFTIANDPIDKQTNPIR